MCRTVGRRGGEGLHSRLAPTEVLAREGYLQPEHEGEEKVPLRDACQLTLESEEDRSEGLTKCLT